PNTVAIASSRSAGVAASAPSWHDGSIDGPAPTTSGLAGPCSEPNAIRSGEASIVSSASSVVVSDVSPVGWYSAVHWRAPAVASSVGAHDHAACAHANPPSGAPDGVEQSSRDEATRNAWVAPARTKLALGSIVRARLASGCASSAPSAVGIRHAIASATV